MNETTSTPRPRGIYILPNLFTIGSLFAGFYAIIAAYKGFYESAAIAIFIAMIMDSLDGRVARLTNTMTAFGAEFDSLSDMVSFAIAPAFLAYSWGLSQLGKFGWIIAFIYLATVALRLARFNTQLGTADKRYFQGIPCPAAAAVVTSLIWMCVNLGINGTFIDLILALITVAVGVLMVSNVRFRSFKDSDLKNNVRFTTILILVLVVVLIAFYPSIALFIVFTAYAISGPAATILGLHKKKRLRKEFSKNRQKNKDNS